MDTQGPVPTPTPYHDRRGWLIAFGVMEIVLAGMCLLVLAASIFSFLVVPSASAQRSGPAGGAYIALLAMCALRGTGPWRGWKHLAGSRIRSWTKVWTKCRRKRGESKRRARR